MDGSVALRVWITEAASNKARDTDKTRDQPMSEMTTESSRKFGFDQPRQIQDTRGGRCNARM